MENNFIIGTIIKKLRLKKQLSQFQLSKLTYISRSTISLIEVGERHPTEDQLSLLSLKLNFDLVNLNKKVTEYKSFEHYLLANELLSYINNNSLDNSSLDKIKYIFETSTVIKEFTYGEPKLIKTYCEACLLIFVDNDIDKALEICLNFFNLEPTCLNKLKLKINMPNLYYSMIITLGYCLSEKNRYYDAILIYSIAMNFFYQLYFNEFVPSPHVDIFFIKVYVIYHNNLANTYFLTDDYDKALDLCCHGVELSVQYNILKSVPLLLSLKTECLYKLNDFKNAKEAYVDFQSLCRVTHNLDFLNNVNNDFQNKYPKLF